MKMEKEQKKKDLKKAIYWYNKAARNGYEVAQYNLTDVKKMKLKLF